MRISTKTDYAVRAAVVLATLAPDELLSGRDLAASQHIPARFLLNILSDLKQAGIVESVRGSDGGYRLAQPAHAITVAWVIRAVEGPLANVHENPPESLTYPPPGEALQKLWVAVRASLRAVLESVTLADVATGNLPEPIPSLIADKDAWQVRTDGLIAARRSKRARRYRGGPVDES